MDHPHGTILTVESVYEHDDGVMARLTGVGGLFDKPFAVVFPAHALDGPPQPGLRYRVSAVFDGFATRVPLEGSGERFAPTEVVHVDSTDRATRGFGADGEPLDAQPMMVQEGTVVRDAGDWVLVDVPTAVWFPRGDVARGPLSGQNRRWLARLDHLMEGRPDPDAERP